MQTLDLVVLGGYFLLLIAIGLICSWRIQKQEDYFMGSRSFGKLLQAFAAFGAGTGAQDPINLGRTTWTSGLSGFWSGLNWLFITPFYWIFAIWYRRMRHLTLGDWFVERYQSKSLGAAYTLFAFTFQILYLSIMFSAVGKVVQPMIGDELTLQFVGWFGSTNPEDLRYIVIPLVALVVVVYGILGGLAAAYWTDLLQGICIIALSLLLIPYGLNELVQRFGADYPELTADGRQLVITDGFTIMHDRLSPEFFQLFDSPRAGEFPIHYILALIIISLVGIVVHPHFIATGGGSAKTENAARIGLVTGNFLKRFCTVGWGFTGLIALALFANRLDLAADPDKVWGVASRELLGGLGLGLCGLMLACLLAALMSSADCYMVVSSALLVRNVYAAYIDPQATERTYVTVGRLAGLLVIIGSVWVSISAYDVFAQYKLALEVAASFAAPFWLGMFWRGATKWAAWAAMLFSVFVFFLAPIIVPLALPTLRDDPNYAISNQIVTVKTTRPARQVDVERRQAHREAWQQARVELTEAMQNWRTLSEQYFPGQIDDVSELPALPPGNQPEQLKRATERLWKARSALQSLGEPGPPIQVGDDFTDTTKIGGRAIFWSAGLESVGPAQMQLVKEETLDEGRGTLVVQQQTGTLRGKGYFKTELLVYHWFGMDLTQQDNAMLETLKLPPRVLTPFLLMILLSWITPKCRREALDRYYAKMKTPVHPDPEMDRQNLELSYEDPHRFDHRKLFPRSSLELQKPRWSDVLGFLASVAICCGVVWLIVWLARLGA